LNPICYGRTISIDSQHFFLQEINLAACPICKKEIATPNKSWIYGHFKVNSYKCPCGAKFREYFQDGIYKFSLKFDKRKGIVEKI